MKAINNWEAVKANSEFESLPAGGYVCEIKSAKEVKNKNTDGTHIEIMLEIADGEFKGFFERDYKAQNGEQKFWRGSINQNIPNEKSEKYDILCSFFKRFTDAIEDGNKGYHWDWNEATLKGKMCGCVFGEKEKQSQKGTLYVATYASEIVSVETIKSGKFKMPAIKKLDPKASTSSFSSFAEARDDGDLPF